MMPPWPWPSVDEEQQDLPLDAIFEILTRCSLPTIATFRATSHQGNSATYDSHLRRLLTHRTGAVFGFFLQGRKYGRQTLTFVNSSSNGNNINKKMDLDFLPHGAHILATSAKQGVMVCETAERPHLPRYYVVKPATRQRVPIPNPKTRYFTRYVGMVVLGPASSGGALRFKIVRLSDPKVGYSHLRCEVFDSAEWRWRQMEEEEGVKLLRSGEEFESMERDQPVSVGGSLHWLTTNRRVVAFDGERERWEFIQIPRRVRRSWRRSREETRVRLTEYKGKLGLICTTRNGGFVQLWVMVNKCGGGYVWELMVSRDMSGVKEKFGLCGEPLGFSDAHTLVLDYDFRVVLFHLRSGEMEVLTSNYWPNFRNGFFPMESDFERCDFRRPEKKATCFRKPRGRGKKEEVCLDMQFA